MSRIYERKTPPEEGGVSARNNIFLREAPGSVHKYRILSRPNLQGAASPPRGNRDLNGPHGRTSSAAEPYGIATGQSHQKHHRESDSEGSCEQRRIHRRPAGARGGE